MNPPTDAGYEKKAPRALIGAEYGNILPGTKVFWLLHLVLAELIIDCEGFYEKRKR